MLLGMDGIGVCREVRAGEAGSASSGVPILMLTARDDETSVVVGLEVGADDYVTKPFRPRELVSRVRAHLRRRRLDAKGVSGKQQKLEFPGLEVDLRGRRVTSGGSNVDLTAKEFEVLALLASHPGRVYGREQIMRHLWDGDFFGETRAADVHIQHIRKKIEPDPKTPGTSRPSAASATGSPRSRPRSEKNPLSLCRFVRSPCSGRRIAW